MVTITEAYPETPESRLYDSIAAYEGREELYEIIHMNSFLATLKQFASMVPRDEAILDAGCGPGRDLKRFSDLGYQSVGVDLNKKFVQMSSKYATAYYSDLLSLPFEDRSFGAVWASNSLVHMEYPLLVKALRELLRVLKPGSPCYFSVVPHMDKNYVLSQSDWQDSITGRKFIQTWEYNYFPYILEHCGYDVSEYWLGEGVMNVFAFSRNRVITSIR